MIDWSRIREIDPLSWGVVCKKCGVSSILPVRVDVQGREFLLGCKNSTLYRVDLHPIGGRSP